jgi:hypothetical protein
MHDGMGSIHMNINVTLSENLRTANGEAAALQTASDELQEIVGKTSIPASAEWDLIQDQRGNRRYKLKFSDCLGEVSGEFTGAELHSPRQLQRRLRRLWGDQLQMRSHRLRERMFEPSTGE